MSKAFFARKSDSVLEELRVSPDVGLKPADVTSRTETYGRNEIEVESKIHPFRLFLSQFNDILVVILILAACVSLGLSFVGGEESEASKTSTTTTTSATCEKQGTLRDISCDQVAATDEDHSESEGVTESLLIFAIVLAIAIIGFLNEYKAEKTVEALKKLVGHNAKVRRNGEEMEIPAAELVPGDIVILDEGTKIPADMRLIEVHSLMVNEASLTGESVPVSKEDKPVKDTASLGDQKGMGFSGTLVTSGTAIGVVTGTGSNTEIGKIAHMVSEVENEQTPMQKKLDDLGRKIGAIVMFICVIVFVVIFFLDESVRNEDVIQRLILAFTAAVALAVAAIPEGLAFVVRISLALGARRMAAKDALVRRLSAVEALGSTDVICSDKTGTLTRGEMTVRQLWVGGTYYGVTGSGYIAEGDFTTKDKKNKEVKLKDKDIKKLHRLLEVGVLCNNARIKEAAVLGDPTEGSLIISAAKAGIDQADIIMQAPRVDEIPFSSDRKMMTTVHKNGSKYLIASKGAVDVLLSKCDFAIHGGKKKKLTKKLREEILAANEQMASDALRVLACAYRETTKQLKGEKQAEKNLIFIGLQGMMDPPREEVKEVMHRVVAEAGMRVIMITGDHIATAKAVAKEIGIDGAAMTGEDIDAITQEEFEARIEDTDVFARVNPEHKIRIVKALKKHGHQVAMTGDGVNDAPAIKAADIGIAMGITGTDAAKEASDLILLDDQFLTIIDAIEEGRGIFDNVRKFVNYLLSANIAEVVTILGGVVFMGKLVLSAAQILFINIVTDGLPAVALGSDPAEKGIMRFKPRRFQGEIINRRIWFEMVIFGMLMSIILLIHYWYIDNQVGDHERAISVVFTAMVVFQMVRLIAIRIDYNIKWFSNPWLSIALLGSLTLQVAVLHIPALADIFGVKPILGIDWLVIVSGSIVLLVIMRIIDAILDKRMYVI